MKTRFLGIFRWLALAVLLLAAGFFYSCGASGFDEAGLTRAQEHTEPADEGEPAAGQEQETTAGQTPAEESAETVSMQTAADIPVTVQPRQIFVFVCGEVLTPGVYEMAEGQRIFEAVEMAGGFTEAAADTWLNLAEPVSDGMKIEIPDESQAADEMWLAVHADGASSKAGTSSAAEGAGWRMTGSTGAAGEFETGGSEGGTDSSKVNINTATKEQLMGLSGIGEVKAASIVAYREQNGAFRQIEDIMQVPGIKDAAFQKIKNSITV